MEDQDNYWDEYIQGMREQFIVTIICIAVWGIANSLFIGGDYAASVGVAAGFVAATLILWASTD
jgi:hypothetical protein